MALQETVGCGDVPKEKYKESDGNEELRNRKLKEGDQQEDYDVTGCTTCGKRECSPPISYIHGSER